MTTDSGIDLSDMLARERRARLAAERKLEQRTRELHEANRKLSSHAETLSHEVVQTREQAQTYRSTAEELRGENTQVRADLERANRQAIKAERRLWDALETIQDGFAVFNAQGQLVIANHAYMALLDGLDAIRPGVTYADILTLMVEEGIVDLGFEDPRAWRARMHARWSAERIDPVVVKLWDGSFMRMVDRRARDGDLVSLVRNITDTVAYEDRLKEERSRAEAANRAKSAFLANMSHEIRTPINGVVGMAQLLTETQLTDNQRQFADTIRDSGEGLLAIINDVLDYSKIEAEKLTLHAAPFDLDATLREVLTLLEPSARKKGIELRMDFDIFLPTRYLGDKGRVRQILTNLIGNAIKFTEKGSVLVRITGIVDHTAEQYQDLHITVEDTGIGIAPNMLDHIFGNFNQVEDERNRKFEGTGLGLAITKQLVGLMGGAIWVDSEPGKGSNFGFRLSLPVDMPAEDATHSVPPTGRAALVVDTRNANRMSLQHILSRLGVDSTICRADDVTEQIVGTHDVVVIDHGETDHEGLAFATSVARMADTPVLLLANAPGPITDTALDAGIADVMARAPSADTLADRLAKLGLVQDGLAARMDSHSQARPMHVLAAEDNRTNQLVFRKMVETLDITLTFAANGREAVEAFHAQRPDLVFMDISMPEMDGKEAAMRIRAAETVGGARVPICALTAHAIQGDDRDILAAGIDHYMTKPLRKAEIVQMIGDNRPKACRQLAPPDI